MRNLILIVFAFSVSFSSLTAFAQVPEFNASVDKHGKIAVDEDYDPRASCNLCKEMYEARHAIKRLDPKDESQEDVVTAGHDVMLKALLGFKSVKSIKSSENALIDYNVQLILLFDRLDRSDDSPTAVERMAAYVENPESKSSYKEALSKVPEALRNRVIERIDEFNRDQAKQNKSESRKATPETSK